MRVIKFCPQCGATYREVKFSEIKENEENKCKSCGFEGKFPEIEEEKLKLLQKEIKKERKWKPIEENGQK